MERVENRPIAQFVPYASTINPSFWHKLSQLKLDVLQLDEKPMNIWGYYSNLNSQAKPLVEVDSTSFNEEYKGLNFYFQYHGILINKNTIEDFKDCDKKALLRTAVDILVDNIKSGNALKNPTLLNVFMILSFADLKKYNFYYWFAFPTLSTIQPTRAETYRLSDILNEGQLNEIYEKYETLDEQNKCYFLLKFKQGIEVWKLKERISTRKENIERYKDFLFAYTDPTTLLHPGWNLRNYVLMLSYLCPVIRGKTLRFLAVRLSRKNGRVRCGSSIIFELEMPEINPDTILQDDWIGYEANERDKMGPRLAKMRDSMSPECLADTAVDLNLKLMKWRLMPNINLEKLKSTKCLLLGAGTLGCAVARNLLAWGIRNITFVDNGHVSYSNAVRQNLYTFEDCVSNKEKATAAAENLKKIFPNVVAEGYTFTIPMPGHPIGESLLEPTKDAYRKLMKLIKDHDVIFLLMDSRESRWLPTVMSITSKKLTINAALGFDTYLVMRHGLHVETDNEVINNPKGLNSIPGNLLGCYFCNDITAPGDSLKDRTLDQQCTVTRPGVSNIAAALTVELAISVLQHEKGGLAPAFYSTKNNPNLNRDNECDLGIVPHSIRGFLSTFSNVMPATKKYNQCIACSDAIIGYYDGRGFEFVMQVLQDSRYLEEITGLSRMHAESAQLDVLELSDDETV